MKKLPTRSDAVKHRELLLDAAEAVFAELGVHVPLELVIERAGVSRATLYRNFVDREALVSALVERGFEKLEAVAARAGTRDDGLFVFLTHVGEGLTEGAPLMNFWEAIDPAHPVIQSTISRFAGLLKPLLRRCKAARLCRQDATARDMVLICSMLCGAKDYGQLFDKRKAMKRALALCFEGLAVREHHGTEKPVAS